MQGELIFYRREIETSMQADQISTTEQKQGQEISEKHQRQERII
jgi:hypothetical protein